ncbi:hypothetical protein Tco_1301498 [Tanacetum coccineum]
MCKSAKEIWDTLLITHQGNSQVKDNKIDLLVQQYEQFSILEEESIDNAFARFNTIITSLKALDEGISSKNYVMKFLRALHPKWHAKTSRNFSKDEEDSQDNHETKESHFKEVEVTMMVKVKEIALDVEIQIISSENVQSRQEAIMKKLSLEEHGVIVAKMRKKRLKTKLVL